MARSTSSHSSSCTDISNNIRFAPTEKFVASLVMTNASNASPGPPGFSVCKINEMMSAPSEFILEWNSMQPTPSPRSTSEAPEFFLTTPFAFLATATDQTPAGTETTSEFPLLKSQWLLPDAALGVSLYQAVCPEASS